MKVTNWRRKLAASLMAGGLLSPTAAHAAGLNTNLLENPSFETVDAGTMCCFSAVKITTGWDDGTQTGFAYDGNLGQGYDAGGPLAGGGPHYFTSNAQGVDVVGVAEFDITKPGQVSQNIDVSTGATANQINVVGEAGVKLSAWFTTYAYNGTSDEDQGVLHVEFLNAAGGSLGSTKITAPDGVATWSQVTGVAFLPMGTSTLRASVYGIPHSGGPDGYIDLTDVQVIDNIAGDLLFLEVNTTNGNVTLKNQTGDPVHLDYYEITSGGPPGDYNNDGTVNTADYAAFRKNVGQSVTLPNDSTKGTVTSADYTEWKANFGKSTGRALNSAGWGSITSAGFQVGNGTGNGWEKAGGADAGIVSESFLTGNSIVANNASINLGTAYALGGTHNLEFRYGVVSDAGFVLPGTLTQGFVRYVTSGAGGGSSVPEPSTVLLVGMGLASLATGRRRKPLDN